MGELEGRQSPGLAAGRVFRLRWRGDTLCDSTSALLPQHRRVNSLRQLLLPYRAGQVVVGLMPVGTAELWDNAGSPVSHTALPRAATQRGQPPATSPGLNTSMLPDKAARCP